MQTVFDRLPEYFIVRYDSDLMDWAKRFKEIGPVKMVILREGVFTDPSPDPTLGPQMLAVRLLARMEKGRGKVHVAPLSDQDEALIRRHCEKMVMLGIKPTAQLIEPERTMLNGH